ncbi:hypothetical protein PM082_004661 [Marasmius tenuissimus]|nr:hypothetical protein PM082_004661 [Marasmius tenuissimus]
MSTNVLTRERHFRSTVAHMSAEVAAHVQVPTPSSVGAPEPRTNHSRKIVEIVVIMLLRTSWTRYTTANHRQFKKFPHSLCLDFSTHNGTTSSGNDNTGYSV